MAPPTRVVRRRTTNNNSKPERSPYARPVALGIGGRPSKTVCTPSSWATAAGRFGKDKETTVVLHKENTPPSAMNHPHISKHRDLVSAKEEETAIAKENPTNDAHKSGNACQKSLPKVCKFWLDDDGIGLCKTKLLGYPCPDLHQWWCGEGFSMLAKLPGHYKPVTGIALPQGRDKLYSASRDGTVRIWDCHTGECKNVMQLGAEAGSLISEGPWVFYGMPNRVAAWNIDTNVKFSLKVDGPVGQVHAMVVGNEMLFAGTHDGVILVWKGCSETNSFRPAAILRGHTRAVMCLTVGGNRLYSGSIDCTIRVWELETLQCVMTLNGHSQPVFSLMCWHQFLFSGSLDRTIKVWAATEEGNLEVTYTHNEELDIIALSIMTDAKSKPILLCSCCDLCSGSDNSVHLYELPSFTDRGRLFAKKHVRAITVGPGGLFFSGDATGLLFVWKWMDSGFKVESS